MVVHQLSHPMQVAAKHLHHRSITAEAIPSKRVGPINRVHVRTKATVGFSEPSRLCVVCSPPPYPMSPTIDYAVVWHFPPLENLARELRRLVMGRVLNDVNQHLGWESLGGGRAGKVRRRSRTPSLLQGTAQVFASNGMLIISWQSLGVANPRVLEAPLNRRASIFFLGGFKFLLSLWSFHPFRPRHKTIN